MTHEQSATVEEQLRGALQQAGLSHHELARRSGVSQPVLSRFIRGERTLTLPVVNKLCDMLGLHLCRGDEPQNQRPPPEQPTAPRGRPRKQPQVEGADQVEEPPQDKASKASGQGGKKASKKGKGKE